MRIKALLPLAFALPVLCGMFYALAPATAAPERLSSRQVFAQVFAPVDATGQPTHDREMMALLEGKIAARHPQFFARFGRDMSSGRPDRVRSAVDDGYNLLRSLGRSKGVAKASPAIGVFEIDESHAIVIIDAEVVQLYVDSAATPASTFARDRLASDLARRYDGRVTQE